MILRGMPRGSRRGEGWRWLLLAALVLLLIFVATRAAAAENLGPGGGSRLIVGDELVGPYRILATSSPNPATPGTITYVVRVTDPQTGAQVKDAQVAVELTPAGGAVLRMPATHANSGNDVDYAAHIPVQQAGTLNGVIRVAGSLGRSEVKFVQTVSAARSLRTAILVGVPFVVVLGVLGALYFVRSGSRKTATA